MVYDDLVQRYAAQFNVPEALIRAVIMVESSGNPKAYRAEPKIKDASYGLMQLLSKTAQWISGRIVSAAELFNPEINIELGTRYLRYQLTRYDGNIEAAAAAYNAGTAFRKKDGSYSNQSYVDEVMKWFNEFSGTDAGTSSPSSGSGNSPEPGGTPSGSGLLIAAIALAGVILFKKLMG